jgi:hypothetical protein
VLAKILTDGIARHHDDPALIVSDQTCTYADLFRLSHALAGSLSERGIQAGDRIAFPQRPGNRPLLLCLLHLGRDRRAAEYSVSAGADRGPARSCRMRLPSTAPKSPLSPPRRRGRIARSGEHSSTASWQVTAS